MAATVGQEGHNGINYVYGTAQESYHKGALKVFEISSFMTLEARPSPRWCAMAQHSRCSVDPFVHMMMAFFNNSLRIKN